MDRRYQMPPINDNEEEKNRFDQEELKSEHVYEENRNSIKKSPQVFLRNQRDENF